MRQGLRFGMGLQQLAVVALARLPPAADGKRVGMQTADGDAQHCERRDPGRDAEIEVGPAHVSEPQRQVGQHVGRPVPRSSPCGPSKVLAGSP